MTHSFPRQAKTGVGERYGPEHQKARRAAAAAHRPTDRCARCRMPLGPMGPHLHYDHAENGGYLGFSHARCNRTAGASKGGLVAAAKHGGRSWERRCSSCKRQFFARVVNQRTCSTECRAELARTRAGGRFKRIKAVPRGTQGAISVCAICSGLHTGRAKYCSPECTAEAHARYQRDRYRAQKGLPVDPAKPTRPSRRLAL